MKLLQKRTRLSTTGRTKNKRKWEIPTFSNDAFLVPLVIGGAVYCYEIIQWLYYDQGIYLAHKFVDLRTDTFTYPYDWRPIVVPGLVFVFSLLVYLGIWDSLRSLLSRSGIRAALSLLRRQLALGVLDLHAWQKSRSEDRIRRSTEKRTPEPGSGSSRASDHRVFSYPHPESIERIVDAPADRHSDHEHQKKHS